MVTPTEPPPAVCTEYRCEKCGYLMGYVQHDALHLTIGGVVYAIIVDGAAICLECGHRRTWYMANWRMIQLLRQRDRAHSIKV